MSQLARDNSQELGIIGDEHPSCMHVYRYHLGIAIGLNVFKPVFGHKPQPHSLTAHNNDNVTIKNK